MSSATPSFLILPFFHSRPELHGFSHGHIDAEPYANAFTDSDSVADAERISHTEPHSECHRDAVVYADRERDRDSKRDIHSQWHADALSDAERLGHADTDGERYADPDINAVGQPGASAERACGVVAVSVAAAR